MPTLQRKQIREVIEQSDRPLSADEIRAEIGITNIGQATVYRAIRAGVDEGLLKLVEVPGSTPRYELASLDHHHHFSCRNCGKVFDIPGCPGGLNKLVPQGFELQEHEILLFGRCDQCA